MTYTVLTAISSWNNRPIREVVPIYTTVYKTKTHHVSPQSIKMCSKNTHKKNKTPTMTNWTAAVGWRSNRVFTCSVAFLSFAVNSAFLLNEENRHGRKKKCSPCRFSLILDLTHQTGADITLTFC